MKRTQALLLSMVACGGLACSGGTSDTTESSTTTATAEGDTGGDVAEMGEAAETPEGERPPLADLHVDDHLTYLVRLGNAHEEEAHVRIASVVDRGGSRAVKLTPVGVPGEAGQLFIAWMVADGDGLVGLEPHVSLGEPGFVPIDASGALVTEAESNIAWRVPKRWLELETRAFQNDPVEGWRLADAMPRIEGPVRMEHCVDLERREGDASRHLRVCRNVGIIGLSVTPEALEEHESWELVDLGQAPEELTRSLAAPGPEPADAIEESDTRNVTADD
ncbi:MAG: hypothetical protein JJ863_30495 [Deltaproteobacteria bacterium]|nr:hypothetical protein [Deltaproteobacteria bacterium]